MDDKLKDALLIFDSDDTHELFDLDEKQQAHVMTAFYNDSIYSYDVGTRSCFIKMKKVRAMVLRKSNDSTE